MHRIAIVLALAALSGCATVTRGTTESLVIETKPVGATATLSSGETCRTPCSIKVKRKHDYAVKLEKAGYETTESTVTSQIAGAGAAGMAGNVLLGGLVGAAVDASTGSTKELKPNPLVVELNPLTDGRSAQEFEPSYFYPPGREEPSAMLITPMSVKGSFGEVTLAEINGLKAPPSRPREFRVPPGQHELLFHRRGKTDEATRPLVINAQAGVYYKFAWRKSDEDIWEPVIFEKTGKPIQTASSR